ncbi:MAG: hypothetical protein ACRDL6_07780 [Solirubrobacterales bacterium]
MRRRKRRREEGPASELEAALVERLQQLDWPRPTAEVKQRCLEDILERMAEMRSREAGAAETPRIEGRQHGLGEQHSLTRRVGALAHREPLPAPARPVRVATVLW